MADEKERSESNDSSDKSPDSSKGGGTATKPKRSKKKTTAQKPPQPLPPWKVLLHNDDKNDMDFVITTIVSLTPLNQQDAKTRTREAHETGVSLLLTTHRERAELYEEQLESKGLVVTIEPAN